MVFGVFLRAICTFKTLNCTVAYGPWGDFLHLGGGHGPLAPLNPPMGGDESGGEGMRERNGSHFWVKFTPLGQEVKGPRHTWPKIDLETWRRHRSQPLWSSSYSISCIRLIFTAI